MVLYQFKQFVVHRQHEQFHHKLEALGVRLYGDLQIGFSACDMWNRNNLFLSGYAMGAPPSRTNPDGQPWGYPVLDPNQYYDKSETGEVTEGPALKFAADRAKKMMTEYDGLRIDHPHGLICPWVYKSDDKDSLHAVQNGARLFDSPALPDHPALANHAIVTQDQLTKDPSVARYADGWVTNLTDEQVERYAILLRAILDLMKDSPGSDLFCEVLSTCPYPLFRVLQRYSLGRFRVTQKADVANPEDVYRSENAQPDDLIMLGNHDTQPIWNVVDNWFAQGKNDERAAYLAERLQPNPEKRAEFAAQLASSKAKMCQAMFADMLASPARNVSIFFADLFGMKEIYNKPGTFDDTNWSLRVPHDYAELYATRVAAGEALSFGTALALALRARYPNPTEPVLALIERLEMQSKFAVIS
jgi:4-alpha-glucanotransferase